MDMLDSPFFEISPIAMWLEDYSEVKKQFDIWREQGVQDLLKFLQQDQSRILQCARKIKILRVNAKTLELYQAKDLDQLCQNLESVFKADMTQTHIKELVALWNGETHFSHSAVNYTLTGKRLDIQLKAKPSSCRGALYLFSDLTLGRRFQPNQTKIRSAPYLGH